MSYDSSGRDTKWSLLVLEMISDIKTPAVKISGKDTKIFSKDTCDLSSHGMVPGLHHVQYFRTTSWLWNDKPFDLFPVAYQDLHRSISSQQLVLSAKEQRSDPSEEFAQPAKSPSRAFTRSDSNESKRGRVGSNVRKNSWRRNSTNILWATSYPTQHQFSYPLSQATPSIWVAQSLGRPFPTWDLQMRNIQSTGPGSANEVLELPGQRQSYPVSSWQAAVRQCNDLTPPASVESGPRLEAKGKGTKASWARRDVYWDNMCRDIFFKCWLKIEKEGRAKFVLH